MSPFNIVELGVVADFINGFAFKPSDWNGKGNKIIRIQNLTDDNKPYNFTDIEVPEKYIVKKGDILVSWSATLDVYEWQDETALLNQHIFKVVPDYNVLDKGYLKYALKQSIQLMLRYTHGSTMKHINRNEFLSTKIPLPPLEEQKRIAAILDKADALRQKRRESIRLLDEFLRSVFLDMFGDPVTNRKGWDEVELKRMVPKDDKINYGVVQPGNDTKAGVPIIRVINFDGMTINKNGLKRIQKEIDVKHKNSRIKGDEILIACVGSIGKIVLTDESMRGFNIVRATARVRCSDKIKRIYLAHYLIKEHIQNYFIKTTRTVSQPTLNIKQIEETPILVPPLKLQEKFEQIYNKTNVIKSQMVTSSQDIENQFNSLVQRAFRGEL